MEKSYFDRFIGHLNTINNHRLKVLVLCFKCGMYKQGLLHDLSKYSYQEFWPSVRYFQGNRSPITYENELYGYSKCWLHHKGRNKHHWEYWIATARGEIKVIEMPFNYMLESTLDRIAASKVYGKDKYNNASPYEFFYKSRERMTMNQENARQILSLLEYLKDNGEHKAIDYYCSLYKKWKTNKDFKI